MKNGFTLVELLLTLMLVAVVISVTIPVITRSISTDELRINNTLYKSAFKTAESIVGDLTSDLNLYPTGNFYNTTTAGYFCNNFAEKLNIVGGISGNCTAASGAIPNAPNFVTSNGMRWYGFYNTFATSNVTVSVDINGVGKGKNLATPRTDILQIIIFDQGRMTTPGNATVFTNEMNYLSQ